MNWGDAIVLLASVVTIASGIVGAVRYLQARSSAHVAPQRSARPPQWPTPYAAQGRAPAIPQEQPDWLARLLPHRGSVIWAALIMAVVPVVVYAVLGFITSTIVTQSQQEVALLGFITVVAGAAGLLTGGIIGGRMAGDPSRALTAMLLAVLLTVLGYFVYKNLTHQLVYLDTLLHSDLATNWLRAQLLLVIGALIGGRSSLRRRTRKR